MANEQETREQQAEDVFLTKLADLLGIEPKDAPVYSEPPYYRISVDIWVPQYGSGGHAALRLRSKKKSIGSEAKAAELCQFCRTLVGDQ